MSKTPAKVTFLYEHESGGRKHNRYRCECGHEFSQRAYMGTPVKFCNACKFGAGKLRRDNPKLYSIWCTMLQRCNNPNVYAYRWYGAKGITVCDDWKNFSSFQHWSSENGYSEGLSIERKENSKGYSPDNCEWIPIEDQPKNKEISYRNKPLTVNGVTKSYLQWAEQSGITPKLIARRLQKGKSPEDAILPHKVSNSKLVTMSGKTQCLGRWCAEYGISHQSVCLRIRRGMSIEEAIVTPKKPGIPLK